MIDGVHGGVTGMVQAIKVDPEHGTDIVYIMTDLEQTEITVRRDQVGRPRTPSESHLGSGEPEM